MGGVIKAVGKITGVNKLLSTGASDAKRKQEEQQRQYNEALQRQQQEREAQENVAQAQAKLAEDSMFEGVEEGLGIEGADIDEVGGKRKRRRKQTTDSGLGIGL